MDRSILEEVITADVPPALPVRGINRVRLKIIDFIKTNWESVSPLLSCPARDNPDRACFSCTDVQVAECALTNPHVVKEEETMSDQKFEFRTREEWTELAKTGAGPGLIVEALKAGGIKMQQYLGGKWDTDRRIEEVLTIQTAMGWVEGGKPAGKKAAAGGKKAAAAAPAPAEEPKAAPAAAAAAAPSTGTAILAEVSELKAQLVELTEFVKDTHYMMRAKMAGEEMLELLKDEEFRGEHYGSLTVGETGND